MSPNAGRTAGLALAAALGAAEARAGEAMQFLLLDSNARATALGSAYTALADGADATHHNPAGLAGVSRNQAAFMHNQYFQGVTQQYVGAAFPKGWGLSINHLDFGSVQKTTVFNPDGTGEKTGQMDLALGAGYARRAGGSTALGAGLKLLYDSMDGSSAGGFAADLGALHRPEEVPGLSLGLTLRNLGPSLRSGSNPEALPMELRLGLAYALTLAVPATLALDLVREREEGTAVNAGLEVAVADGMLARAGFDSRKDADSLPAFGLGWRGRRLGVDYALAPFGELGLAHRVSLSLAWD